MQSPSVLCRYSEIWICGRKRGGGRMSERRQGVANFAQRKKEVASTRGERMGAFKDGDAVGIYLTGA